MFLRLRSKSTYIYPDTTTAPGAAYTACVTTAKEALATGLLSADPTVKNNAQGDYEAALTTCTKTYQNAMCPAAALGADGTLANGDLTNLPSGASAAWQAAATAYNTIVKTTLPTAYVHAISVNPTTLSYVQAARQADLTGATRAYLSSACTNFYTTSTIDPSALYQGWTIASSTPAAQTTSTGIYYFNNSASQPIATASAAWDGTSVKWLKYAASFAGISSSSKPTTPLLSSGSSWNNLVPYSLTATPSSTGLYATSSTVINASGVPQGPPNWAVARDFGPGTMLTAPPSGIPITWPTEGLNITITTAGSGYTAAPRIELNGGRMVAGVAPTCTATVSNGSISFIYCPPGVYTDPPFVNIIPDAGNIITTPAVAVASIVGQAVLKGTLLYA